MGEISVAPNVTENDIKYGIKNACQACPLARAVKRVLLKYGFDVVKVYDWHVTATRLVDGQPEEWMADCFRANNMSVHRFVNDFDRGLEVEPGQFILTFKHPTVPF